MTRYPTGTFLSGGVRLLTGKLAGGHLLALVCSLLQEVRAVSQTFRRPNGTCNLSASSRSKNYQGTSGSAGCNAFPRML